MSNIDREIVNDIFQQLIETLERIQRSMSTITKPEMFYANEEGREKLDAISMKLWQCVYARGKNEYRDDDVGVKWSLISTSRVGGGSPQYCVTTLIFSPTGTGGL